MPRARRCDRVRAADGKHLIREAAAQLGGGLTPVPVALTRRRLKTARHHAMRPIDTEVLAAALELHSNRLTAVGCARDYMAGRERLQRRDDAEDATAVV